MKHYLQTGLAGLLTLFVLTNVNASQDHSKTPQSGSDQNLKLKQALGRKLYFDTGLSEPAGQACAGCHLPSTGFADPDSELPVSRGADPAHFGNRNTPTTAYAAFTPEFHYDKKEGLYIGGFFLDGRAHTMQDQAKGPFLNPLEMGNPDAASLINKVRQAKYSSMFDQVFGPGALSDVQQAFDYVADALVAFEHSNDFSPFNAKYDYYLEGEVQLTAAEQRGLELFEDEKKGNCAACHPSQKKTDGSHPLFTDYSYDNIGVPRLKDSPFYYIEKTFNPAGDQYIDLGLGRVLNQPAENGKFKVPTLRNLTKTAPYMHNGVFKTLEEVVDFYNSRDSTEKNFKPEVVENMNDEELGDLNLSKQEEQDIIAFLKTLTDGYILP